jgi:2-keto-3-deoxy-L-rhamnonate aldolase RhmA
MMPIGTFGDPAVVGPWIKLPTPMSVEVMFAAGADFVCIDMCNGWLGIDQVSELLAYRTGAGPRLVRLAADAAPAQVGQLLDAGADGIVIPHVESVSHAQRMVAAALFVPVGSRGMGSTGRAGQWGLAPLATYLDGGRLDASPPSVSVMIETGEALRQVQQLARIPGVSQLLIGTADLSADLGRDPARLAQATDEVLRACAEHGLSAGIATGTAADAAHYIAKGFDSIFVSNDLTLMARSAQQCFTAARTVSEPSNA